MVSTAQMQAQASDRGLAANRVREAQAQHQATELQVSASLLRHQELPPWKLRAVASAPCA